MCNGSADRNRCTLIKANYMAVSAHKEHECIISEARLGFAIDEDEADRLDAIATPLLKNGHSWHNICVNNADRIMRSERALNNYVGASLAGKLAACLRCNQNRLTNPMATAGDGQPYMAALAIMNRLR